MEHLDFIVWMCLYPIALSASSYIDARKNEIKGIVQNVTEESDGWSALVLVIIWLFVGYKLY